MLRRCNKSALRAVNAVGIHTESRIVSAYALHDAIEDYQDTSRPQIAKRLSNAPARGGDVWMPVASSFREANNEVKSLPRLRNS